jgi:hypothetical protein
MLFSFKEIVKSEISYQESPHSENKASTRSEKEEREREHVFIRISISN